MNIFLLIKVYLTLNNQLTIRCDDGCRHGVLEAWVERNYDDDNFVTMAGEICEKLDDERASCWEGIGGGLYTRMSQSVWANGQKRIYALPEVSNACEHIAESLPESKRHDAIEWCQDGAFRHYADALTTSLDDDDYVKEFPGFCDPPPLQHDAHLLEHCHEAQVRTDVLSIFIQYSIDVFGCF